jgi:hypothetical protein
LTSPALNPHRNRVRQSSAGFRFRLQLRDNFSTNSKSHKKHSPEYHLTYLSSQPSTMASRSFSKTLSSRLARQLIPAVQRRSFAALTSTVRPTVSRAIVAGSQIQSRGVKTVDFAGHKEQVFERADWPREKLLVCFHFRASGVRIPRLTPA